MTPLDLARLDLRLFELRMSRMSAEELNDPYVLALYGQSREWERQVRRVCRPKRRSKPTPAPPATPRKYLTAREAAGYLGIPYSTFRKVAPAGIKKQPGTGRYRPEDLDAFAASRPKLKRRN